MGARQALPHPGHLSPKLRFQKRYMVAEKEPNSLRDAP